MKVGLFIPCYIDALFPEVCVATLELVERLGCHGAQGARSLTVQLLAAPGGATPGS